LLLRAALLMTVYLLLVVAPVFAVAEVAKPDILLPTVYRVPDDADEHWVKAYWVSEKLDGIRAYWTGRVLLTKQGNVIHSPANFTKAWPLVPMDGELWVARGQFEKVSSIVRRKVPQELAWKAVRFMVFDLPTHTGSFSERLAAMKTLLVNSENSTLAMIEQRRVNSLTALEHLLDTVVAANGEGLMLHRQDAVYQLGRSSQLMKMKTYYDAEAVVVEHYRGKGKYKNDLGSCLVRMSDGTEFKIGSGFSDQQRKDPPAIGSIITFKYFGKTARGVPRFASFIRVRKESE